MKPIAVTLELARTPPSLNKQGRAHPMKQYRLKSDLQDELEVLLLASKLPRELEHVTAQATMRFKTARRRDEGNYRWLLEKALGDALQNGGWLPDDTPEFFMFGAVTFEVEHGPARTLVDIRARRWAE